MGDGNLLERCQPGIKGKKYADFIIAEANIDNLYLNILKDKYKPALIDASRALELNIESPYVLKLHAFIGIELEKFRKEIEEKESKKEKSLQDKEIDKQLEEISKTLNDALIEDWDKLDLASASIQNLSNNQKKINLSKKQSLQEVLLPGEEILGKNPNKEDTDPEDKERRKRIKNKIKDIKNNLKKEEKKNNSSNAGGLTIVQMPLGKEALRAEFKKDTSTIIINSDFPTVKKFKDEGKSNNPHFISYLREIALTELAIAVTTILEQKPEFTTDSINALQDLRSKINDYSLKFHGI